MLRPKGIKKIEAKSNINADTVEKLLTQDVPKEKQQNMNNN